MKTGTLFLAILLVFFNSVTLYTQVLKKNNPIKVQKTAKASKTGLAAQGRTIRVKNSGVAFLGIESIAENRFHKTLEERVYLKLSYNKSIDLEDRDFYFRAKSRGFISKKVISLNEALKLTKIFGDRIYVSGEIRDYKLYFKRKWGFLPFGKVCGEIVCYLQVIDAVEKDTRFAGNLKFVGEMDIGYIGFSQSPDFIPISPVDEKHFVIELVEGMVETFAEIAEASYIGILIKKKRKIYKKKSSAKRRIIKRTK